MDYKSNFRWRDASEKSVLLSTINQKLAVKKTWEKIIRFGSNSACNNNNLSVVASPYDKISINVFFTDKYGWVRHYSKPLYRVLKNLVYSSKCVSKYLIYIHQLQAFYFHVVHVLEAFSHQRLGLGFWHWSIVNETSRVVSSISIHQIHHFEFARTETSAMYSSVL